jgi:sporulation protein YlmC with PRC-barrel domain
MENTTTITSGTLISAEHVQGTNVYNTQGEKLGSVEDVMLDKVSGRAMYALMSFGGFLGIGENYHPLPWSTLKYDTNLGGYVVNLSKDNLEKAPMYDRDSDFTWTPEYGRKVDSYYNASSYWI